MSPVIGRFKILDFSWDNALYKDPPVQYDSNLVAKISWKTCHYLCHCKVVCLQIFKFSSCYFDRYFIRGLTDTFAISFLVLFVSQASCKYYINLFEITLFSDLLSEYKGRGNFINSEFIIYSFHIKNNQSYFPQHFYSTRKKKYDPLLQYRKFSAYRPHCLRHGFRQFKKKQQRP